MSYVILSLGLILYSIKKSFSINWRNSCQKHFLSLKTPLNDISPTLCEQVSNNSDIGNDPTCSLRPGGLFIVRCDASICFQTCIRSLFMDNGWTKICALFAHQSPQKFYILGSWNILYKIYCSLEGGRAMIMKFNGWEYNVYHLKISHTSWLTSFSFLLLENSCILIPGENAAHRRVLSHASTV